MTLVEGLRYRARIHLGMFEQVASNESIRERLEGAGFMNVAVGGSGHDRFAEGTWGWPSQDVDLPSEIVADSVEVIP